MNWRRAEREKIGGESLGRALDFMNYLKSHAVRIYSANSRAAVDLLIESGHIWAEAKSAAATGGRPTMTYVWNPRLDGG